MNDSPLKIIGSIFALAIVVAIAITVYLGITRAGTYKVSIIIAPADSQVTIDGHKVSGDTIYLAPGEHTYTVSRSDFRSYSDTVTITDNGEQYISAALESINDAGRAYASQVDSEYSKVLEIGGITAEQQGEKFTDKNPITKDLPYSNMLFSIGYRLDPSDASGSSIIVTIDSSDVYRENAITQLKNLGYNPAEYNIEFTDLENPFL